MHNRTGPRVTSHEIGWRDALAVAPLVAVILVLAFYPQFFLARSQPTVNTDPAINMTPVVQVAAR
jgi:hypothetical protein